MTAQVKPSRLRLSFRRRADFEILSRTVYGKPLVYLDSAASAQKPRQVLDAMHAFAVSDYANVHRGVHYLSATATEHYENARESRAEVPERRRGGRNRLHQGRHRGDQSRGRFVSGAAHRSRATRSCLR